MKRMAIALAPCRLAVVALALPVLAGLAWMAWAGAPPRYLLVNGAALTIAIILGATLRPPLGRTAHELLALGFLAVLAIPLLTGPSVDGVSRWVPLGPIAIHSGMLAIPSLTVLASRLPRHAGAILLVALALVVLQPDPASALAIACSAAALIRRRSDWMLIVIAGIALLAAWSLTQDDALQPVRFVEGVLQQAAAASQVSGAALAAAWATGAVLLALAVPGAPGRALAASLVAFAAASLLGPYPAPLIGYGAAPILGYGVALGLAKGRSR